MSFRASVQMEAMGSNHPGLGFLVLEDRTFHGQYFPDLRVYFTVCCIASNSYVACSVSVSEGFLQFASLCGVVP